MNHLSQIADKLSQYDLDAMLIVSEPGERYAVGFQGEGYVLVTQEGSQYSTDGRYIEAAQKQVTGAEVVLTSRERSHLALARDFLAARGLKRVGFESAAVSVAQHRRWQESFPKGCELIPAQELLDGLRVSKDEEEIAAMVQAQKITDAAFGEILNYIRPGLTEQEVAARLMDGLRERGAQATFFVIGRQIQENQDLVERMQAEGHQVGSHTWSHVRLTGISADTLQQEVGRTEEALENLLGEGSYWLRPPYGAVDEADRVLIQTPMIKWSIGPRDWEKRDAAQVTAAVLEAAAPNQIILLHDIYDTSVDAALAIVDALQAEGYRFVTVAELLEANGIQPEAGVLYCSGGT